MSQVHAPLAQLLNGAVIVFAAAAMMLLSSVEVDLWLWGYAVSVGITLLWAGSAPEDQGVAGSGRGFLSDMFYPVGLVSTSLEMALVLVFIGFDYCPGLFLLVRNRHDTHSTTFFDASSPASFGFCRAKFTFQHSGPCGTSFLSSSTLSAAVEQALAYYASSLIIVYSTPRWIRAMFFATQLVLTDVSLSR